VRTYTALVRGMIHMGQTDPQGQDCDSTLAPPCTWLSARKGGLLLPTGP
jgi:hypothetical protein